MEYKNRMKHTEDTMKVFKSEKSKEKILETYNQLLKMWGVSYQEKDIETAYGLTHVIECGNIENPPLVLFHGVGDNSALMWIYNAKVLSEKYHLFAIDTIGGPGKSIPNKNYNKMFDQLKWIDDILDKLKITKTNMAGVSNGAYITQHYCIKRPERILKAICMAGSVYDSESSHPMKAMMKVFLPEALFPTKKNTEKLIKKLSGKNSSVFTNNKLIMEHYQWLLKGFNNMAMSYHRLVSFHADEIKGIQGKCLFLCGEADPLGDVEKVKGKLERHGLNYQLFPEVGHGINHEIASEINSVILNFLGAIDAVNGSWYGW